MLLEASIFLWKIKKIENSVWTVYSHLLSKVHLQSNLYLQETISNVEINKYKIKIYKRQKAFLSS